MPLLIVYRQRNSKLIDNRTVLCKEMGEKKVEAIIMMMMAAATSARTSNTTQMNISEMSIRRWIVQCFLSARRAGSEVASNPIHCAQPYLDSGLCQLNIEYRANVLRPLGQFCLIFLSFYFFRSYFASSTGQYNQTLYYILCAPVFSRYDTSIASY